MRKYFVLVALSCVTFFAGCVAGGGYPESYANAYCGTMFACFDQDSIDNVVGWDNVSDCKEETADRIRETSGYDGWEEGDLAFNSDAAANCIDEVQEFRVDSDCDGRSLDVLSFGLFSIDVDHNDCSAVYE
jgi:hypothetical protein